jgi:hypothetical protein
MAGMLHYPHSLKPAILLAQLRDPRLPRATDDEDPVG